MNPQIMPTDTPARDMDGDSVPEQPRSFTKIVATIGPASEGCIRELVAAGMSVARLNFSHGEPEEHQARIETIRQVAQSMRRPVGILGDLPGPKMRTGTFPGGHVDLEEGESVRLRSGGGTALAGEVLLDIPDIHLSLDPGHRVSLADGQVELVVEKTYGEVVQARVTRAGAVGDRKGIHFPDSDVQYEVPTDDDRRWIQFAVDHQLDFIGVSFVGNASEIEHVRSLAGTQAIVAKIERRQAIEHLAEILEAADGVMVARGDLGVEIGLADLPGLQKMILERTLDARKFTITATEMLESMVHSSRPTRAEVTDVANAVLDGTDAVMLSAETAAGAHPVAAVNTMREIARSVEKSPRYRRRPRLKLDAMDATFGTSIAMAAAQVARALQLDKVICFTESGGTVRLISRYRPGNEIIGLSPNLGVVRQMTVLGHVRPALFRREASLEEMFDMAAEMLVVREIAEVGQEVVFVAGVPPGVVNSTNVMKLHRIGESTKLS
ncbi:MAG TPA: pyruvate kinase [Planctomycetota bacterium]|nr:pyruvate kinase [Planctomycetota bacterium]